MARHKKPDNELKHPRRIRRSTSVAERKGGVKKPSKRILKLWKPLVELCMQQVIMQDKRDNIAKKDRVAIKWSEKMEKPHSFPSSGGKVNKEGVPTYAADLVLIWLYENWLCDVTPAMLYAKRRFFFGELTRTNDFIDKLLDIEKDFI